MSSIARTIAITLIALAAATAGANDYMDNSAYYPIVTKANGAGGTNWLTEVSITNPQSHAIKVRIELSHSGSTEEWTVEVPAGRTFSWTDFLGDGLSRSGNAALYLHADEDDNPGYDDDCLEFLSSVKIYNSGGAGGTFGQEVPKADPFSGFLGSYIGLFTGVKNYGQAGGDGFRTNIGFWHTGYSTETVRATLYDRAGNQVWQKLITVERHKPFLTSIPATVEAGILVIDPMGEFVDCAVYVSVVDNRSGDGALRSLTKLHPDDAGACGSPFAKSLVQPEWHGPQSREEAEDRLARLFAGEPGVAFAD